jgi:hypothetical protein
LSPGFEPLFCPLPDEPDCCLSSFFVLVRILTSGFLTRGMNVVDGAHNSFLPRAKRTAVNILLGLDPVPDHFGSAVSADRRQFVYRALETIENVPFSGRNYFKRKVIIVTANLAACHFALLPFLTA